MSTAYEAASHVTAPRRSPLPSARELTSPWQDAQHDYYAQMTRSDPRYAGISSAPPTTVAFHHPHHHQSNEDGDGGHPSPRYSLYPEMHPYSAPRGYHYGPNLQMPPPQDFQPYPLDHSPASAQSPASARPIPFAQKSQPLLYPPYDRSQHEGSISPSPSIDQLSTSPPGSYPGHASSYEYASPVSSLPSASSLPNLPYSASWPPQQQQPPQPDGTSDRSATQSPLLLSAVGPAGPEPSFKREPPTTVHFPPLNDPDRMPQGTPFISKLLHLLNNEKYRDYIRWNAAGDAFILSHTNQYFASQVLPIYFRHSNTSSFVRQLNLYGFSRLPIMQLLETLDDGSAGLAGSTAPSSCFSGFSHPYLLRDNQDLSRQIKPKASSKPRDRSASARRAAAATAADGSKPRSASKALPKGSKTTKRSTREDSEAQDADMSPTEPAMQLLEPAQPAQWASATA